MGSKWWEGVLWAIAAILIAWGVQQGLSEITVGEGINSSSCGSAWQPHYQSPNSGDSAANLANMAACLVALGKSGDAAQLPLVVGLCTVIGTIMVKMALAGRREAAGQRVDGESATG